MDTKADMDGAMVELPGGIEAIRALDSAQTEGAFRAAAQKGDAPSPGHGLL